MLSGAHHPSSPRTPRSKHSHSIKITDEEAVSMFGANGSRFIEDLMRTDPVIVEGIAKSGSLEALLGSVYSPFRGGGSSPAMTSYMAKSPWTPPNTKSQTFGFPMSPSYEPGSIRRSARLTPSATTPGHTQVWPTEQGDHDRGSKRRRGESGNSSPFRKSLRMDGEKEGGTDGTDFGAFAMGPAVPLTPFDEHSPGAHANLVQRKISSEKRPKAAAAAANNPKRGEYKCGKCGFYPKKEKHDCAAHRIKLEREGRAHKPKSKSKAAAAREEEEEHNDL